MGLHTLSYTHAYKDADKHVYTNIELFVCKVYIDTLHFRSSFGKMYSKNSNKQHFEIFTASLILLDISAVVLNGLVAYVLRKSERTKRITFWFIVNLSLSDVMVGITGIVYHLLKLRLFLLPSRTFWASLTSVAEHCLDFFFLTSGNLIFSIAIDRCIHMRYLQRYGMIMTKFRARIAMIINIFIGLLFLIPSYLVSTTAAYWYYFSFNILHSIGTFMVYVIYI